ncbi:MAG: LysR family transcriptional regulator [Prolixibacteraceae bacterium]|nr:LysR family transcriptional regulator [Burkholderiales bacterium]
MHRQPTQREPLKDHTAQEAFGKNADWESIRIFLEIVRSGSFRAAADRLGVSFSAVRRRVVALEHHLGTLLMTRHTGGIRLTEEGERIAAAARQMEIASHGIVRANESMSSQISGNVKISTTEGTGTFWLIPRLVELQRAYPGLLIDFNCTMNPAYVSNLEADVSVQLRRPSSPDLIITKLGRLHTMPFAAQSYIDLFGVPKTLEEMGRHRYALHISEQTQAKKLFTDLFPGKPWSGLVAMTTNTASAHLWSISKGIGIGWLPTYAHLIGGRILPVEIGPRFQLDVWLAYHPDVTKIARVRRVIDWIKESFDAKKFPWFGDKFIHPYDLPKSYLGKPLINLFEGFVQHNPLQPNDIPGFNEFQKPVSA